MLKNLGAFHSELLSFLAKNCQKRIEEEELDPEADLLLKNLLKELSPTAADQPLPLTEIIDNYHHLFQAKGPVHLEKTLMEAFPAKEFMELNLTRYYPKVYRGLPRLYSRDQASQCHIKKSFTHLASLKKQAVSRALFSLYGKLPAKGTLTLFTWVINDGLGDFIAASEVLQLFKARFPDLSLRLVILIQEQMIPHLALPPSSLVIPYQKEAPFSLITQEALDLLRSSDLILQIPTHYPHTDELKKAVPDVRFESVGEYGFVESSWFHPRTGNYSLGLHFLEKGILIRKPYLATWDQIGNQQLRAWHEPKNHFYLAYLSTAIGGAIYLHALLKSLENDPKDIDLCVPDLRWFSQFSDRQKAAGRPLLEWDLGLASIEILFQDNVHTIPIAPSGKKLRLLCPGLITQNDFRALLSLSGDWVAIRGNQSFSEVISQNKPFFYDGRDHARYFIKDLGALAENRISAHKGTLECIRGIVQGFLYNLPAQTEEWVEETYFQELEEWTAIALRIGLSLQDPDTLKGYAALNRIIAEEFSANAFLCHLVQRALCHKARPDIEQFEKEELKKFVTYEETFTQMIGNLREIL